MKGDVGGFVFFIVRDFIILGILFWVRRMQIGVLSMAVVDVVGRVVHNGCEALTI